jgi:ClpP class serine protease
MIGHELREFVDRVMDHHAIDDEDVKMLQREILNDAALTREVIDVLVALDRAVPQTCTAFADYLVALTVDYAVWESRPTGVIDRDKAHWLVTTLSAGDGPTATAQRIAFEIVREAERCDEALIAFALRKGSQSARRLDCQHFALAS